MQTSPSPDAASPYRCCSSCGALYPPNTTHNCAAVAETLNNPNRAAIKPPSAAEAAPKHQDHLIGATVGERYEILNRIDHGGMGVVYRARHALLENFLAVKILLRPQDGEAQHRFLLEAKLASKLNHPNTVHILDFGLLEDGRSYLVMELLSGPTLARALKKGRFDSLRACQIAVQIARGLCAVHSAGIVHREV